MHSELLHGGLVCTFRLGQYNFGLAVDDIQEVLRSQALTEVPLAPDEVMGLINLRGRIVTAIDLRQCLGLEALKDGQASMNIVMRQEAGGVSLLVDEIGDVVDVQVSGMESVPETVEPSFGRKLTGVYKMERELLLILDVRKICSEGMLENVDNPEELQAF